MGKEIPKGIFLANERYEEEFLKNIKEKKNGSIVIGWDEINARLLSEYKVYIQNLKTTHKITKEEVYIEDNTANDKFKKLLTILSYADERDYFDMAKNGIHKLMKKKKKYDKVQENQIYLSQEEIDSIKKEMQRIIEQKLPIESKLLPYADAIDLFTKQNMKESLEQLGLNCPPLVKICSIGDFADLQFQTLLANSAQIHSFDLTKYENECY